MPILKHILKFLKVGGLFFWTIKLPSMNGDGDSVKDMLSRNIKAFYEEFPEFSTEYKLKWLLANKNERSFLVKKISHSPNLPTNKQT